MDPGHFSMSKSANLYSNSVFVVFMCFGENKVKVAQSCLTLYNLMDYMVHEILQEKKTSIIWDENQNSSDSYPHSK